MGQSTMRSTLRQNKAQKTGSIGIENIHIENAGYIEQEEMGGVRSSDNDAPVSRAIIEKQSAAMFSDKRNSINHQFNQEVLVGTPLELQGNKYANFKNHYNGLVAATGTDGFARKLDNYGRPSTQGSPSILRLQSRNRNTRLQNID